MKPRTRPRVHIRWMLRRDSEEVLDIEANGEAMQPWSEDELFDCLRRRNCIGMVAETGDRVIGFMVYELHRRHLELLNLGVHPMFRRLGVGRQMIAKLVAKLSTHQRRSVAVDVAESNLPGLLFFKAMAFRAVEVIRGGDEDAYRMERS